MNNSRDVIPSNQNLNRLLLYGSLKAGLDKKFSYRRETRATLCISWNVVLLLYK